MTPFHAWCEMKTKTRMSRNLQLALASAVFALLVVGAIFYGDTARFSQGARYVRSAKTSRVEQLMSRGLSSFNSAEEFKRDSSMRIFL